MSEHHANGKPRTFEDLASALEAIAQAEKRLEQRHQERLRQLDRRMRISIASIIVGALLMLLGALLNYLTRQP
jgi:ABC-type Fe3+-siderophore transport system permease subunit